MTPRRCVSIGTAALPATATPPREQTGKGDQAGVDLGPRPPARGDDESVEAAVKGDACDREEPSLRVSSSASRARNRPPRRAWACSASKGLIRLALPLTAWFRPRTTRLKSPRGRSRLYRRRRRYRGGGHRRRSRSLVRLAPRRSTEASTSQLNSYVRRRVRRAYRRCTRGVPACSNPFLTMAVRRGSFHAGPRLVLRVRTSRMWSRFAASCKVVRPWCDLAAQCWPCSAPSSTSVCARVLVQFRRGAI